MLLEGLRVIELATWIAAPGCAAVMADWGADVIKVETVGGDTVRGFYPDTAEAPGNPVFAMENRGKRSVVLDIASVDGRAAMLALLSSADVFITNLRPKALERLGLDYPSLKEHAPRLIYATVSGYGLDGPDVDLPAFDVTHFWARSGVAAAMIPPDQEPFPNRPGFGDHVTGLATLTGVLAALHERHTTGRGRLVEGSLLRAGTYALGWDLSVQLRYGEVVTAQPRNDRLHVFLVWFRTGDNRWLYIAPRGPGCFAAVMDMIGRAGALDDPRYALPFTDIAVTREVRGWVEAALGAMTFDEAVAALNARDLAWAPLTTPAEVANSVQAAATGCFEEIGDGWGGVMRSPAAPVRFPEGAPAVTRAPPRLGAHTEEVLRDVQG